MATRAQAIAAWVDAWGAVNAGRYKVIRGFFDPRTWSFQRDPYLVTVSIASDTVIARMDPHGYQGLPQPMEIETWILAKSTPPVPVANKSYLLNDADLVQMMTDLTAVVDACLAAQIDGRRVITETATDSVEEFADEEAGVVGLRYTLTVLY